MLIVELRPGERLLIGTHASRRYAPQRDTICTYKFKNLNMKISLKLKINPIREYL
jgi:hypothetical protein